MEIITQKVMSHPVPSNEYRRLKLSMKMRCGVPEEWYDAKFDSCSLILVYFLEQ